MEWSRVCQGWSFNVPTEEFYNSFEDGDSRRDATILDIEALQLPQVQATLKDMTIQVTLIINIFQEQVNQEVKQS